MKSLSSHGVRCHGKMNPPAPLNLKTTRDASKTWKTFKQAWQVYEIASGTAEKDPLFRLATFLHVAGPDALEKYNGFLFESEEDKANIEKVLEKFDCDCKSSINVLAERHNFYSRRQSETETIDQYVTDLRILASSCEFQNNDETLRDQFALNIRSVAARERLFVEAQENHKSLSFGKAISIVKSYESLQSSRVQKFCNHDDRMDDSLEIDKIERKYKKIMRCKFCGKSHVYGKCPAYGKQCSKCRRKNHFAAVCKTKGYVQELKELSESFESINTNIDDEEAII